jgi:hypothetical protein
MRGRAVSQRIQCFGERFRERDLWNVPMALGSLRLDVGRADHFAPLFGFIRDQLSKGRCCE